MSNGVASSYDPLGRLSQITLGANSTRFLYDGDDLVAEYDGTGAMTRRYVHWVGDDTPLLSYAGATLNQPSYLHADQQGSIVMVSSQNGNPSINRYDEYGIPAAANVGRFQYTGQAWLAELGMYYYKARIYSPTLGRFLQTDPIGYDDQFNLYSYAGNDPVNNTDPTGMCVGPLIIPCGIVAYDLIVPELTILVGGAMVMSRPQMPSPDIPTADPIVSRNDNGGPPLDDLPVAVPDLSDRIGARTNVLNRRHYQAAVREGRGR